MWAPTARARSRACGARSPSTSCTASARTSRSTRSCSRHPEFVAGDYDTGFIERHKAELAPAAADDETATLAAIAAAAAVDAAGGAGSSSSELDLSATQLSAWRRDKNE